MVGSLSPEKEAKYGSIFSKYLADPANLYDKLNISLKDNIPSSEWKQHATWTMHNHLSRFVISSDFCHWGSRFRYNYYDQSKGNIYQSIQHLDKLVWNTYFCSRYLDISYCIYLWFLLIPGHGHRGIVKTCGLYRLLEEVWKHDLWTPSDWSFAQCTPIM